MRLLAWGVAVAALSTASGAAADETTRASIESDTTRPVPERTAANLEAAASYYRLFGGLALGRGIRFNNPYRLQTELGDGAESLSLTATYADAWAGAALGSPDGFQQGAVLHGSKATDGITQEVLTPGYIALYPIGHRFIVGGRVGLPIVIEPDANVGAEIAALGTFLVTAGIGVSAELIGSLFYGAATLDTPRTAIPIVSFQLGASLDYEVLP